MHAVAVCVLPIIRKDGNGKVCFAIGIIFAGMPAICSSLVPDNFDFAKPYFVMPAFVILSTKPNLLKLSEWIPIH
jgi:hypothetical protein